jgi:histidinol-phosphate aminotransferase
VSTAQAPHGGPDTLGVPLHDFSTNSNACGPCPHTLAALQACDACRYPDPTYTALKEQLAEFHCVEPGRIVIAGSASEFIFRITAWVMRLGWQQGWLHGGQTVRVPVHAYGDYAQAARAWGMSIVTAGPVALQWHADPSSPLGQSVPHDSAPSGASVQVLDCAYEPLRLGGTTVWTPAQRDTLWQLYTPNKALGLTGVRAAYAIAPVGSARAVAGLNALCASWPLGAHGVALLQSWVHADTQAWLYGSLQTLCGWKLRQTQLLRDAGWTVLPSETPFFCAQPPAEVDAVELCVQLRAQGIKLRDATSFGLPGWVRISVQAPASQDALRTVAPHPNLEISHAS